MMNAATIIARMKAHADPRNVAGMERFGIVSKHVLGLNAPYIKEMASEIGRDHSLALQLWRSGILEARILAALIDDPDRVTPAQMDRWAGEFDSWAVCDGVCLHLFAGTPHAWKQAMKWSGDKREYVRRAGFTLMACLAVHDKEALDAAFDKCFPRIMKGAADGRNFVKKAVNWALRQIGKRNRALNNKAVTFARELKKSESPAAKWVATDALRELTGAAVQRRLKR
jgi:3-methyladenine DNA glycosylase AlkD